MTDRGYVAGTVPRTDGRPEPDLIAGDGQWTAEGVRDYMMFSELNPSAEDVEELETTLRNFGGVTLRIPDDTGRQVAMCWMAGRLQVGGIHGATAQRLVEVAVKDAAARNGSTRTSKVRPVLLDELLGQTDEPPDWVVPGYAARQEVTMLASAPKVGKTTLLAELALHVAAGGEFLGQRIDSTSVLWFNLEQAARRTRQQFRELARHLGMGGHDLPLHILSERDKRFDWQGYCLEHEIGLAIIDSLAKWWSVINVNDSTETEQAIETLRAGAERTNAAVWAILPLTQKRGQVW